MFSIQFHSSTTSEKLGHGQIEIDSFKESFEVDLSFWKPAEYKRQWVEAISRSVNGSDISCLVTSISDPSYANFFTWWPMYRSGELIIFQNGIFLLEDATQPILLEDIYSHVPKREFISEDGTPISEWKTAVSNLSLFLERMHKRD